MSSVLHPINQDIFENFKANYQKMVLRGMIAAIENKESYIIDVLKALHLTKAAW